METLESISFIIFLEILIFYLIIFSPQLQRCAIIPSKHGIYELHLEFSNDLRLRTSGSYEYQETV